MKKQRYMASVIILALLVVTAVSCEKKSGLEKLGADADKALSDGKKSLDGALK